MDSVKKALHGHGQTRGADFNVSRVVLTRSGRADEERKTNVGHMGHCRIDTTISALAAISSEASVV